MLQGKVEQFPDITSFSITACLFNLFFATSCSVLF